MANYHEYSKKECTDKEDVGLGIGEAEDGSTRICISVSGTHIHPDLHETNDWISLSEEAAHHLYLLLKDRFEHSLTLPLCVQPDGLENPLIFPLHIKPDMYPISSPPQKIDHLKLALRKFFQELRPIDRGTR